jgi:hypothetical protein
MNLFANKWLSEWLQGLGKITLLAERIIVRQTPYEIKVS